MRLVRARDAREGDAVPYRQGKIGGWLTFSRVALQMHLEGDAAALDAYAYGERESPNVVAHFQRLNIPIPA